MSARSAKKPRAKLVYDELVAKTARQAAREAQERKAKGR
jgi:hypothetical protein